MEDTHITNEDLDLILSKYFKTLEDLQKEQEELNKIIEENNKKEKEEYENKLLNDEETKTEFLTLLEDIKINTQYQNNFIFFSIVITGTILVSVLMYKCIKIFI